MFPRVVLLSVAVVAVQAYYVKPLRPWERLQMQIKDTDLPAEAPEEASFITVRQYLEDEPNANANAEPAAAEANANANANTNTNTNAEEPAAGEEEEAPAMGFAKEDMAAKNEAEARLPYAAQSIVIGKPPQVVITPEFLHEEDDVDPAHWVEVVPPGRATEPERVTSSAEKEEGEVYTPKEAEAVESAMEPENEGEGNLKDRLSSNVNTETNTSGYNEEAYGEGEGATPAAEESTGYGDEAPATNNANSEDSYGDAAAVTDDSLGYE